MKDYAPILCSLADKFGWTPTEVGRLTLAQLHALFEFVTRDPREFTDPRTGKPALHFDSLAEAQAYMASKKQW